MHYLPDIIFQTVMHLYMHDHALTSKDRDVFKQYSDLDKCVVSLWNEHPIFPHPPPKYDFPSGSIAILSSSHTEAIKLSRQIAEPFDTLPLIITDHIERDINIKGLPFVRITGPIYIDIYTTWTAPHQFTYLYDWTIYDLSHFCTCTFIPTFHVYGYETSLRTCKIAMGHLIPLVNQSTERTLWLVIDNREYSVGNKAFYGLVTACDKKCPSHNSIEHVLDSIT